MVKRFPMTVQGAEKLQNELSYLKNITRPKIISAISEAREHGDLKENSEYHIAREEQSFCEGRIKDIENKLFHSQIIDISKIPNTGKVIFGVTVTILNLETKKKFTYCIVGNDESDFKKQFISINSPIARGLIGKSLNEIAHILTPGGNVNYKIIKIEHI
ncbi:Transcription elongation factor GreA [Buchnera aphidicola (Eriosoma grossulariae)]|uniref:transcription elongation factor GreA n=1 Tax=Buchnera aphidicola TaxID=9 RepID=UPI0034645CF4